ncbi:MAG: hypothetical protein AB7P61_04950 [Gemmatimonadales bacterium]
MNRRRSRASSGRCRCSACRSGHRRGDPGRGAGSLVRDLGFAGTASASGTVLQLDGTVGLRGPLALTLGATGWGRDDRRYLTVVGEQDTRTDGRRDGLRLPVQ